METAPQQPNQFANLPPEAVILQLRQRVEAGHTLSRDEVRTALQALRQNRMNAAEQAGKPKRAASAPARSSTELLGMLKSKTVGETS